MNSLIEIPDSEVTKLETDALIQRIETEGDRLLDWAGRRVIDTNDDLVAATADLGVIANLLKEAEAKRKEYTGPLNAFIKRVNDYFKTATDSLQQADRLNRDKVKAFKAEVERRCREAEAIEAGRLELARREMALKGEITGDLSPVSAPEPVPAKVHTPVGSMGTRKTAQWELVDIDQVPRDFLTLDTTKVGRVVRAGIREIPGIRIWEEENIVIRSQS